jgi:hypothetical protein
MMLRKLSSLFVVTAALGLPAAIAVTAPAAIADTVEHHNVRGTVVSFGDDVLKVKSREGAVVDVALSKGWQISSVAKASVSDIKPGDYVGIASLPKEAGGDGALEVLIFPPALKGAGEGSFAWDLKPKSNMTNATVANAVKGVDGQSVTVTYHGQEKTITVPEGAPVVTLAPATPADLVPGAVVFIPATQEGSGPLTSGRVVVGTKGIVPPM